MFDCAVRHALRTYSAKKELNRVKDCYTADGLNDLIKAQTMRNKDKTLDIGQYEF